MTETVRVGSVVAIAIGMAVIVAAMFPLRRLFARRFSQLDAQDVLRRRVDERQPFDEYHAELDGDLAGYRMALITGHNYWAEGLVSPDGGRVLRPTTDNVNRWQAQRRIIKVRPPL